MKLALIRRQFAATGGAELYLQRLLETLSGAGHELHLFAEHWTEAPPGVAVHRVLAGGSRATRPLRFAAAVEAELAPHRFDCVFSLERTLRQDVYRAGDGVHRVWLQRRRQFAPWWRKPFTGLGTFHGNLRRLEERTFDPRNTRHIIANSEMVKREISDHFPFPPERIHVVRNGVDVARFQGGKRAETRARFGIRDDEFLLLFVGSGWERKGLRFVLSALLRLQTGRGLRRIGTALARGWRTGVIEEARLTALMFDRANPRREEAMKRYFRAMPGSERAGALRVEAVAALMADRVKLLVVGKGRKPWSCPARVIFAGSMPDVENAYAAADLFVFLPLYEPSANVVCEALAAGVPVVTSAQNGASELIEPTINGTVLDDPRDTRQVVEVIAAWWLHRFYVPPVRAAQLSLDRNVSETLAVLERAASERLGQPGSRLQ